MFTKRSEPTWAGPRVPDVHGDPSSPSSRLGEVRQYPKSPEKKLLPHCAQSFSRLWLRRAPEAHSGDAGALPLHTASSRPRPPTGGPPAPGGHHARGSARTVGSWAGGAAPRRRAGWQPGHPRTSLGLPSKRISGIAAHTRAGCRANTEMQHVCTGHAGGQLLTPGDGTTRGAAWALPETRGRQFRR